MITTDNEEDIKIVARDWLLRFSLGSPTAQERAEFSAWIAQDPRHAEAYRRFESIWQDAATLDELKPLAALPPPRDSWWRRAGDSLRVHPLRWAAGASLILVVTAAGLWYELGPLHYATGVAEVREIHLSDGSDVTLGALSSIDVAFRAHERRVALTSGVAFFSVSKNPVRPFIVTVSDKQVRVVGTKFEISRDPSGIRVSVVEGTVEVMQAPGHLIDASREVPRVVAKAAPPASANIPDGTAIAPTLLTTLSPPPERILTAGQQVTTLSAGAIPEPQAMPRGEPAAWRHGRLVYIDAPLKDIIADANRYSRHPIEIADEDVADVRVSVTYPSDRIEEMVSALSRSLSLKVERRETGVIVLRGSRPSD